MSESRNPDPDTRLAELRAGTRQGGIGAETTEILPGLELRADPALGMAGSWRSPRGRLIEIESRPANPGAWFGLHLALPAAVLPPAGLVALACRSTADVPGTIRACLRSGVTAGFVDRFFDKPVVSGPEPASHLDAIAAVPDDPDLPVRARWRELVLFLPTAPARWSLIDLRLVMV